MATVIDAYTNPNKVFVEVTAIFDTEGGIHPVSFIWEDGERYEIVKVVDIRRKASTRAGGFGDRYTVIINNRERYIFMDENRWYIERKEG